MTVEVLYYADKLQQYDIVGILVAETKLVGIINNFPIRRQVVPSYPIDVFQNNNRRIRVYVKTPTLLPVDITGATVIFTVKESRNSEDIIIQKSTAVSGEGEIGSPDEGECFFYLVPEDTADLDITQYVYDVTVFTSDDLVYTVAEGQLNLLKQVYQEPAP